MEPGLFSLGGVGFSCLGSGDGGGDGVRVSDGGGEGGTIGDGGGIGVLIEWDFCLCFFSGM